MIVKGRQNVRWLVVKNFAGVNNVAENPIDVC